MEQLLTLLKLNFKFKCNNCYQKGNYINEFSECASCEKCKRCYSQRRDYLNDFQICNSCCKQIEQMTPSGFKPNLKFEKCKICYEENNYLNKFNECESCEKCKRCNDQRRDYSNNFQI